MRRLPSCRLNVSWFVGLAATVVLAACSLARAFTLVEDGKAKAVLVVAKEAQPRAEDAAKVAKAGKAKRSRRGQPADPYADERLAAAEIQDYVARISGVRLEIVCGAEDLKGLKGVYLGSAADAKCLEAVKAKSSDPASFALVVTPEAVSLRGLSSLSTYFAACELLEQLGVRWYMPGELGTVVPEAATLSLKEQNTVQVPSFPSRHLQGVRANLWEKHLRAGGPQFPSSHGINLGQKPNVLFKEHPEYFALRNGNRKTSQLCISNPEVLKLAIQATKKFFRNNPNAEIIGMGPNDGGGYCECDECKKLDGGDFDALGNRESMTDRYIWFFNKVLEGIQDEFPTKRIGFYAYASYNRLPVKNKPDKRIVPAVAMITVCRLHGMNNPICPEKDAERQIIKAWGAVVPEVYDRGYWFNLADPGLPFYMIRRIAADVPEGKKLGVAGWRVECMTNWAGSSPSLYLALKMMWDCTLDYKTLMAEFYEKFYGPAAKPMQTYIETLDNAVTDGNYHAGGIWDMPLVYDAKVRAAAKAALDEAAKAAPADSVYAKRVDLCRKTFAFLEGFIDIMDGRTVHDYARAKKGLDQMNAVREQLYNKDRTLSLICDKSENYTNRYLTSTVMQGYARVNDGNKLLVGLKDEWRFQTDPKNEGQAANWFDPKRDDSKWRTLKTSSMTWSAQGLREYKGLGWYRQTVEIPAEAKGRRVFLWCGAVDESSQVWVNGKSIGISARAPFKPFEMDATEAIEAGKPNVVTVCVQNTRLDELGTGGIMGPVMFYLPAAGKDAQLENAKPLGKVFPEY